MAKNKLKQSTKCFMYSLITGVIMAIIRFINSNEIDIIKFISISAIIYFLLISTKAIEKYIDGDFYED